MTSTSWDNYFNLNSDFWLDDIKYEILADNYYRLGINTLLFGILVKHIDDDYIPFCVEDFEKVRLEFYKTGRPVIERAFTDADLLEFLRRFSSPDNSSYFIDLGDNHYIANMKVILGTIKCTEEEKNFFHNDARELRTFALFCRLHLNLKLTDCHLTAHLLKLKKLV